MRRSLNRSERPHARMGLGHVLVRVVVGAHERPGGDVLEAELVGGALEGGDLVALSSMRSSGTKQQSSTGSHCTRLASGHARRRGVNVVAKLLTPAIPGSSIARCHATIMHTDDAVRAISSVG